jgi:uncharacterized protein (TIGR00255 family)
MIRSMTGFGRASFRVDGTSFDVEVRSVNHRYLDARVRLPRQLAGLEPEIRERIERHSSRGKVDMSVVTPEAAAAIQRLEVDLEAAREYARAAGQLREEAGIAGELSIDALLGLPGVSRFVERELAPEALRDELLSAADEALAAMDVMRVAEGAALERDLLERLANTEALAHALESRSEVVRQAARERLRKRTEQLGIETGLIDPARLHQEIVIAADRLDITEEIVRLRSHVQQCRDILGGAEVGNPVGRQLDFLLQELGREANTIGAKGGDADIAHQIVELKTELERIREQVQNVE